MLHGAEADEQTAGACTAVPAVALSMLEEAAARTNISNVSPHESA